jgi:hypothetical protein
MVSEAVGRLQRLSGRGGAPTARIRYGGCLVDRRAALNGIASSKGGGGGGTDVAMDERVLVRQAVCLAAAGGTCGTGLTKRDEG